MKIIPTIIILFISTSLYSQVKQTTLPQLLDSLKHELNIAKNDSGRAEIFVQLAWYYNTTNPDSTIYFGRQAIDLAGKIKEPLIAVSIMGFIANAYHNLGDLPKALETAMQSIAEYDALLINHDDQIGQIAPSYSTLGDLYADIGNYRQAIAYYNRMSGGREQYKDPVGMGVKHFEIASVYEKMNKLDSALLELNESYKSFSEAKPGGSYDIYPRIYPVAPNWYNVRANVYFKQEKTDSALHDLFTSLNMTLKNDESYYVANSYNDIANLYSKLGITDSVIYYAKKGLETANKISYAGGILSASEMLAGQYDGKDDAEALRYLKLANRMRNRLYGVGNIQAMKDMMAQNEKKQEELAIAKTAYQNRLRTNILLAGIFVLLLIAFFLYRNSRLKQRAKQDIENAYNQLKSTQSQLIQSEKMASLGELTAGIAHEIQNPLNFVNNFSEVNKELITELVDEVDKGNTEEVKAIANDIKDNSEKINHHGRRADAIVKGMLQHSRSSTGVKEPTDINALCDEYLRLAYHGLRAKDKSFNAKFETDFDEAIPKINIVPQDIGRVILNLINNAFYAVNERLRQAQPDSHYEPLVSVQTKKIENKIEIRVRDNGNGIPDSIKEKIFQPFFTTKPTGEGTGLGLSLSYDIIKAHGGEIKVETKEGAGSEFAIYLPIS